MGDTKIATHSRFVLKIILNMFSVEIVDCLFCRRRIIISAAVGTVVLIFFPQIPFDDCGWFFFPLLSGSIIHKRDVSAAEEYLIAVAGLIRHKAQSSLSSYELIFPLRRLFCFATTWK